MVLIHGDSIILEDATEATDIVFAIGLEAPADQADSISWFWYNILN